MFKKARGAGNAQRHGAAFEKLILRQCSRAGIKCIQQFVQTSQSNGRLFYRAKGSTDFLILSNSRCLFFDAKSFDSDRITYSQINRHQLQELKEITEQGFKAGYLVYLRKLELIVFYDYMTLCSLQTKASLNQNQGLIVSTRQIGFEPDINFDTLFSKGV